MFNKPVNNYGVRYNTPSQSYPSSYDNYSNTSQPYTTTQYNNYYRSSSQPYQTAPSNNYYRSPSSSVNNSVRFVSMPMRSFSAPPITMGANPGIFGSQTMSSLGSNLLRSPIGVPASNGFVPRIGGLLGNLGQGAGLGSKLSGLSFSSILGGIQKTVSTVNQVVPLYQQIKPVISNGKTFLKMMRASKNINAFTDDTPETLVKNEENTEVKVDKENVIEMVEKKTEPEMDFNKKPQTEPAKPFYA